MPTNLRRHDELGHVHFLTISCYHRLPFFGSTAVREIVTTCMGRCRDRMGFQWVGYVIMPEHVHWLIYPQLKSSNPADGAASLPDSPTFPFGKDGAPSPKHGSKNQLDREIATPPGAGAPSFAQQRLGNPADGEGPAPLPPALIPISTVLQSLKTSIARNVKQQLRAVWADQRTLADRRLDQWALSSRPTKPIWTTRGIDFNVTSFEKLKEKLDYCQANPVKRGLVNTPEAWRWSSFRYYELEDDSALRMDWDGIWPLN